MDRLLQSYAQDLNDAYPGHEHSLWSKMKLLEWFNEGVCLIATQRPDLFTDLKVIKVDPCSSYLDLCDCNRVLKVLGQSTKSGKIIKRLPRRKTTQNNWTGKQRVSPGFVRELSGYEIVEDSNLVQVYPENLDPDRDIYVLVRCSIDAEHYELDSDPPSDRCAFLAAARHYVLYNAKMVDSEFSVNMKESAIEHRNMFTGILNMAKEADDKYNNDYDKDRR